VLGIVNCRRSSWTGPLDVVGETFFEEDDVFSSTAFESCSVTEGSVAVVDRVSMSSLAVTDTSS
jgi:hypothetical protein